MKVIRCKDIEGVLSEYLMGSLDAARTRLVQAHLERCERCRRSADDIRSTLEALRQASGLPADTPRRLDPSRVAQILRTPRHPLLWRVERHLLLMAVVVTGAVVANVAFLMLRPPRRARPAAGRSVEVRIAPEPEPATNRLDRQEHPSPTPP